MPIVGDGKIFGIPYLPVKDGGASSDQYGYGSGNPNWQPGYTPRPELVEDEREDIPFPGSEFPDYKKGEREPGQPQDPDGDSKRRKRTNAPTDPINQREKKPLDLGDALGVPSWQEVLWDQLVNTPPAVGGLRNPFPSEPPKPMPPLPGGGGTRGPQGNECSTGKIPHYRYGGNHNASSTLVQFRVWRWEGRREPFDDGVEHTYFQNGIPPYLYAQIYGAYGRIGVRGDHNWKSKSKETMGLKFGGYFWVNEYFSSHRDHLLWMPKRKVFVWRYTWSINFFYLHAHLYPRPWDVWLSSPDYDATVDCVMRFEEAPTSGNYQPPRDRGKDMGCRWQKDEIEYTLPKLKIGSSEVGGETIKIDDGMLPFANYMCKSIEVMFKGLGLDKVNEHEMPKNILKRGLLDEKVRFNSLGEMTAWQFNNLAGLIGAPVETVVKNIEGDEKTINFRSVQDVLSFLFNQQKESDSDLWVIENYLVRIAQQVEAVTQIVIKQEADIEMLVKEAGFRWNWETRERDTFYKIGMKDDDPKTGIIELFKGGKVSYPVRVWADKLDSRQIAGATNLYAEIAAKGNMFKISSKEDIPGLAARKKMNKANEENWLEYLKTVNDAGGVAGTADKGSSPRVVSGYSLPRIEEYTVGTYEAKKPKDPESGLSLFQKKPKEKKKK